MELLVVVLLLGILAAALAPHYSASSRDAKLNELKASLAVMRKAIERYAAEHDGVYPGARPSGIVGPNTPEQHFRNQLLLHTRADGLAKRTKDVANGYRYGPYLKYGQLPANPYNRRRDLVVDTTTTDITRRDADGASGWKFFALTGVLIANDNSATEEAVPTSKF